jgi:HD-GYP domain-containing protein (c-di-GMP phosphodiesterase class II)
MPNGDLTVVVIIGVFVAALALGFYFGRLLEKERAEKRKRKSPSFIASSSQDLRSPGTYTDIPSTAKNREIINSLFSTLIKLKGKDLNEIYSVLATFVQSNTCAHYVAILSRENRAYTVKGSAGLSALTAEKMKLSEDDGLIRWLNEKNTPINLSSKRGDAQLRYFQQFSENISDSILYPLSPAHDLVGVLVAMNNKKGGTFSEADEYLFSIISGIYAFFIHNLRLDVELEQTNLNTIIAFAIFLEKRDKYTQGHSERVRDLSTQLAKKMRFDMAFINKIKRASALHDIGKIGIPDMILNKPGKLNDDEFQKIKEHPEIAARMLEPLTFLKDSLPGILYHHEKVDGTGYPKGLKGDDIPVEAQIISVADVYDALTTDRPYRLAFPHDMALNMMWEMNRKNFNAEILREFVSMVSDKSKKSNPEVKK